MNIPDAHNVVRYIKPTAIEQNGSISGAEFCLSPGRPDEVGVSVNWLECFLGGKEEQLAEVRRLRRTEWRRNGCLAELNVGTTLQHVAAELAGLEELAGLAIAFESVPLEAEEDHDADPSHAEIRGLLREPPEWATLVGDTIAECITHKYPAIA